MRSWVIVCAGLIAAGLGLFTYKVVVLGYPLSTAGAPGTWRVELVFNATGEGGRSVIEAGLPQTSGYHRLLTEEVRSGRLRFSISEADSSRRGRWSGKLDGTITLSYEVTVETLTYARRLPEKESRSSPYPKMVSPFLEESPGVQVNDPAIADLSRELLLDGSDKVKLVEEIYDFVSREIGTVRSGSPMGAVSVVREGRGNPVGRARLFCALSRLNGLPCRVVAGLKLAGGRQEALHYWNEAYLDTGWVPFDVVERRKTAIPPDRLVLSVSQRDWVESSGTTAVSHRFYVQSELETYTDLLRRRLSDSQNPVDRLSLLFLPVQAQHTLRFLLLVPLGALSMSVLRNIVGIRTFGTFMPVLIALSFTGVGFLWGTLLLALIISFALLSRLWIQRFYLLLAPRIAFVLTLVILLMVVVIMVGDSIGLPITGVGAFPFVIMTMIVERISVSLEEEGTVNTLRRVGSTVVAIYLTYAVIQAGALQTIFLVFPELIVIILGLIMGVGRYTGFRLTEIIRFRAHLKSAS
jgi:hypothetical protein